MSEIKNETEMLKEEVAADVTATVEKKSGLKASFQTLNFRGGIYAK